MSRKLLMFAPALAFALPIVASQPTMARPLATQAEEARWGNDHDDNDDDDDDDDGGGSDEFIALQVCFQAQLVLAEDDRSYSCDMIEGEACLARCTPEAVAPLCSAQLGSRALGSEFTACQEERLETCRSQCDSGGAAFCSPQSDDMKVRGGDNDDHDDDDDDDKGNDNIEENIDIHHEDGFIFIDVEICLDLVFAKDDR